MDDRFDRVTHTVSGSSAHGGRAAGYLRQHNRVTVLETIRAAGPLSKSEISRRSGLSTGSVTELVNGLMNEGLVVDGGEGASTGGRRPTLLRIASQSRSAIGLEIGTRSITVVLTDLDAKTTKRVSVESGMSSGPAEVERRVNNALERVMDEAGPDLNQILGIGVALPAPMLRPKGASFSPPSFAHWGELDLREVVGERFGLPMLVDNDANARAVGEHLFGAGRGFPHMLYVVVHRGVGGALLLDGQLRRGGRGGAGEIGHTVVDIDGPQCGCGRHGCLEAFVGRGAIARRTREAIKRAGDNHLAGVAVDELKAQEVIEAALNGDIVATGILRETGEYLGIGIANAINTLDPDVVVVGGSTMRAGNLILGPAIEVACKGALEGFADETRIVTADLAEDAGAVGAAALVIKELFASSASGVEQASARTHKGKAAADRRGYVGGQNETAEQEPVP